MNERKEPSEAENEGAASDESTGSSPPEKPEEKSPESDDGALSAETDGEAGADPQPEDDLPEWEPLTPELVEDEAVRGDFMLRWAVILLALLLGWTVIQQTSVLTHIKSGQAIAADGFLPPATDPLSSTGGDVKWTNLSWLWDLTVAGVYGALGDSGLSVLKAVMAAVVFWLLSRISLPNVPTWWGSVCGALALIAAFPSLTATPPIVTLLGMVLLLSWLPLGQHESQRHSFWPIAAVLLVWNQFDDRAWIGLGVLLVFAAGDWWDTRASAGEDGRGASLLGKVAIACVPVMLVHPFLWETLLSPLVRYQVEYPALQSYANRDVSFLYERFPVWSEQFWEISYFNGAGLLLWGAAIVTLVLNAQRLRVSHLALFVFSTLLMVCGGGELAVAGIIHAVLATLNAQQWYQSSFRQTYTIETAELLFSRGGRAVTVMAFFALGFAMVGGHLTGADGRRVGMGFDQPLKQEIASYAQVLEDSFDDRPFNFRLAQGDVLNWVGQKPFIDSRLRLFAAGSSSIMKEHQEARIALRVPRDGTGLAANRDVWTTTFDRHEVTHVLPRLTGGFPDYKTFVDLSGSSDWALTKLGAATAAFYRMDSTDPLLNAYVAGHQTTGFVEPVLRSRSQETLVKGGRTLWPQSPSVYDRYAFRPRSTSTNSLQLARHYASLAENRTASVGEVVAVLYAAIRQTHDGLAENPSDPTAYHVLAQSYGTLWQIERNLMQQRGLTYPGSMRYLQTVAAYQHVLACDPSDEIAHFQLFRIYLEQQRHDLAEHHLRRFQDLSGSLTVLSESNPNHSDAEQQMSESLATMTSAITEARLKLQEDLEAGADRILMAQTVAQAGYPLLALEALEENLTVISGNPAAAHLYGRLLLEAGRTSEAYDQLQSVKRIGEQQQLPGEWPTDVAMSEVIAEDLRGALETLSDEHKRLSVSSAAMLMQFGPLKMSGPPAADGQADPLITVSRRTQMVGVYYEQLLPRLEASSMRQAFIELELGENGSASDHFLGILQGNPISSLRPIAEVYLSLLSETPEIPPLPDMDAEASEIEDLVADDDAAEADTPAVKEDRSTNDR